LASLVLNFVFPHIALANDISRNNTLNFNYTDTVNVIPHVIEKGTIFVFEGQKTGNEPKDDLKVLDLPVDKTVRKQKITKIVVLTLAKNVIDEVVDTPEEEYNAIADKICKDAGINDLPCWQDLKAMRQKESYDGKAMTGDGGKSRGWYHIQTKMHKITDACAMDFKCSTEWTVKYLISNGYTANRVYAISRHNGSGIMAQNYARSVVYNSAKYK
jgi:hypothetical protein